MASSQHFLKKNFFPRTSAPVSKAKTALLELARCQNLALKKPAYQSSTLTYSPCGQFSASKAVDGNRDPSTNNCSCSHTSMATPSDPDKWLAVDLGRKYQFDYVDVYNRQDINYRLAKIITKRLDNFWIGLTNVDVQIMAPQRGQYPLCGQYPGSMAFAVKGVVKCNYNLPPGRFLIVQMDLNASDKGPMAICEVEAFLYHGAISMNGIMWKAMDNVALQNYIVDTKNSVKGGLSECIFICMNNATRCDSINRNPSTKSCEFNQHINGYNRSSLIPSPGWKFWSATFP